MKWFSRAKSLTIFVALAAQIFLPAFHRDAQASPFSVVPEKLPQPPVKTLLASTPAPFVIQVEPVVIQHKSTARAEALLKKLGEALKKNVRIDITTNTPKDPKKNVGLCARYSVLAIKATGIHIKSADSKNMPPNLIDAEYEKIELKKDEQPLPGDAVVIIPPNETHPHGHMQVYGPDGIWYSGFAQKDRWPYGDVKMQESLMTYFRHDAFSAVDVQIEHAQKFTMGIDPAYFMRDRLRELDTPWKLAHPAQPNAVDWLAGTLGVATPHQELDSATHTPLPLAADLPACDSGRAEKDTAPKISAKTWGRSREDLAVDQAASKTAELHAQWHEARKAVLKRNAALKQGTPNELAEKKLHASLKKMNGCVADVMKSNPIAAFKAARYICNKCDEDSRLSSINKQKLLLLISKNLGVISNADEDLGRQAANYVIKKAGKGPLRETVLASVRKQTPYNLIS